MLDPAPSPSHNTQPGHPPASLVSQHPHSNLPERPTIPLVNIYEPNYESLLNTKFVHMFSPHAATWGVVPSRHSRNSLCKRLVAPFVCSYESYYKSLLHQSYLSYPYLYRSIPLHSSLIRALHSSLTESQLIAWCTPLRTPSCTTASPFLQLSLPGLLLHLPFLHPLLCSSG